MKYFKGDLTYAILRNCDFEPSGNQRAILTEVNFSSADLTGSNLRHVHMSHVSFRAADLTNVCLDGVTICDNDSPPSVDRITSFDHAKLVGAHLYGACLRETSLCHADMTDAKGLIAPALAGCDLTGATLPADVDVSKPLKNIEELSKNIGKLIVGMVSAAFYALISISGVSPGDFISSRGTVALPFTGTSVSLAQFLFYSPLLLTGSYIYVHAYLRSLWIELKDLPRHFPDSYEYNRKTYPWITNDAPQVFHSLVTLNSWLFGFLLSCASFLVIWAFPLIALIECWSINRNKSALSDNKSYFVLPIAICIVTMILSIAHTIRVLTYHCENKKTGYRIAKLKRITVLYKITSWPNRVVYLRLYRVKIFHNYKHIIVAPMKENAPNRTPKSAIRIINPLTALIISIYMVFSLLNQISNIPRQTLNLSGMNLSEKLTSGSFSYEKDVIGLHAAQKDLRRITFQRSYFPHSDFSNSNLEYDSLEYARAQHSIFNHASLNNIRAIDGQFDYCDFTNSQMAEADLSSASMQHANLNNVTFTDLKANSCNFRGASFTGSTMVGDFSSADLTDTTFDQSGIIIANSANTIHETYEWNIKGANLRGAHFENTAHFQNENYLNGSRNWMLAYYRPETAFKLFGQLGHNSRVPSKNFSYYQLKSPIELNECDMSSFNLDHSRLERVSILDSNLTDCNFNSAILRGVYFSGSPTDEKHVGVLALNIKFDGATLESSDDKTQTIFENYDLSGGTFANATITGVQFTNCVFNNVIFNGATLTDAQFTDCPQLNQILPGATGTWQVISNGVPHCYQRETKNAKVKLVPCSKSTPN
ncbi:pentapeptide repeat-containing protein [Capsulimonas corticalis]|nr:pentapeptide repeat-containing protein [Capsulimonas corticalis]